jgi:hypothetical protein
MAAKKRRKSAISSSRKGKSKLKRFLIGILVLLFLVFGIFSAVIYFYGNDLLKKYITETVKSTSKGLYQVEIKSLFIDLVTGNIRISGFRLTPDTVIYRKLRETDTVAPILVSARITKLRVSGIDFLRALRDKDIAIKKILVQAPELDVHIYPPQSGGKKNGQKKILLAIPIPKGIRSIGLKLLQIREGKLTVYFHSPGKTTHIHVPDIGITATSFYIDSKPRSGNKIFNAEDIQLVLKNLVLETANKMNTIHFGVIRVSTGSSEIGIENFHFQPLFSRHEYCRKLGYQVDRLDVQAKSMRLKGVGLRDLVGEHKLIIGTIDVDGLVLDDYRDKRIPERAGFYPLMPQQALLKAKQYMKIGHVTLKNGKAIYCEQVGTEPGVLFFDKMEVSVTNITNDPVMVSKHAVMEVNGTAWLMGKGKLSARIRFPLGAPGDAFTFSGALSRMALKEINPMLTKLAPAVITAGTLDNLVIPLVSADNETARGMLKFYYSGLKVNLLNQKTDSWSKIKTTLLNTAANIYIKNDNPSQNGVFRTGIICFNRVKTASIFNFLWKSTFSGLKSTMGINTEEQKEMKKRGKKK